MKIVSWNIRYGIEMRPAARLVEAGIHPFTGRNFGNAVLSP